MYSVQKVAEYLTRLPVDARVEIILADLVAKGMPMEDLVVIPKGLFKRNFHRDIDEVQLTEYDYHKGERVVLEINREGLYDALPEGLFHQPMQVGQREKDKETVIKEILAQRERQKAARKFFLPIEQEIYRVRVALEFEEQKYFVTPENILKQEIFQQFWEIPSFLNPWQVCSMIYLLPIANHIVGNFRLTELCLEAILNVPIAIKNTFPLKHEIDLKTKSPDDQVEVLYEYGLGSCNLGSELVLSGGVYQETIPAILIKIGPIPVAEVGSYLSSTLGERTIKGNNRLILDYLLENFFPFEADVVIDIQPALPKDSYFSLGEDSSPAGSLLAFDAILWYNIHLKKKRG